MRDAGYLPVARVAKPHGLRGEVVVFVLTGRAEQVFVPGQALTPLDAMGRPAGAALTLERGRRYHRRWLLKFEGVNERTPVEAWRSVVLGVPAEKLEPEDPTVLPEHEVPGAAVLVGERVIGTARTVVPVPGGALLVVDGPEREMLIPYRPPIVVRTDRARREIVIGPPPGLLEL